MKSRAYLRKDPGFFEKKAIVQDYPAGAYVALDGVLCLAESQPQRGRFRDDRLLRALLGRYGRWVPLLVEKGDLVELADGRLYVEGWDEWQEGDWKVGERVSRIRNRRKVTPGVTVPTVTSGTTRPVYTPSPPPLRESLNQESISGGVAKRSGAPLPKKNGATSMSTDRAQAVLDDPNASDEAKAGARAYLDMAGRWGKTPTRAGDAF